jgi:hypothetical protein
MREPRFTLGTVILGTILGFVLFALSGMTGGMGIKVANGEWGRIRFEFMWWLCFCFWTMIGVLIVAYADLPISWKKGPPKVPESRKQ